VKRAHWPFRLPAAATPQRVAEVEQRLESLAASAQYGWGDTMDFGHFRRDGILGEGYLTIAGALD
jgi:hypothetical protein